MKLRFLFIAIASVILFAACEKEYPSSLANIQLDKTYLSIPAAGGSASLKVTATEPWTLSKDIKVGDNKEYTPAWLTASPVSGEAGETTITFTAEAIDGGREQEFHIECGKEIQYFIVRQGVLTPTEATCAEVMQAPDGKSFRVTATIVSWASNAEKYGNMWINDGTGEIQIYGMADKDGKLQNYPIASWGLDIGDIITVDGPKSTYGTTIELVDVTVVKVVKSLLKLDKNAFDLPKEGGEITVKAAYKGNGVFVTPQSEWISLESMDYVEGTPSKLEPNPADTAVVKFLVAPNTDVKPRTGSFSVNSSATDSNGKVISTTMDVTVKQGANAPDLSSIADGVKAGYAHVKGRVMAICNRGYILADETGAFLAYYGSAFKADNYAIGDEIELVDQFTHYNFGLQMSCDGKPEGFALEEKVSAGNGTVTYPTPKNLDKDALIAYVESIKGKTSSVENCIPVEYVQISGVPKKNGNYTNIYIDNYADADISAYQLPASFDLASMLDKNVTIRGYTQSISGGKHLNIVFTELVEGEPLPPAPEETPALFLNEFDTLNKFMEIYNASDKEVDIAGWKFVKDDGKEDKDIYEIPSSLAASKVPAKGYAVFTCKTGDVTKGPLFGLSGNKGFKIELKKGDTVVDMVDNLTSITVIPDGKSWGRETDGAATFVIFDTPTIGSANGVVAPEQASYKKVANVTSGKKYLIVAKNVNGKMLAATPIPADKTYGRLNGTEVTVSDDTISGADESLEFTFTAVEGGYNIAMSDGRLLGGDATHNGTFQIGDDYDHLFTVTPREDGTVTIAYPSQGRTFYHGGSNGSTIYTNFSLATEVPSDGVYPWLFERQ
ncbi:MAG: lamin tail domain-containing protein [Bacteroidales bacterium]|nr:lamin tail domain-containing protein [Bacteroidales bacterium]